MDFKKNDFVSLDFEIYANGKLIQTSDESKGKAVNLNLKEYKPMRMILGKNFILKALDDDIVINNNSNNILELGVDDAYGRRKKELLKMFSKSSFDEKKMKPVQGMTYDFNGTYGSVKSVVGGRVLVDFNNPLSGKKIKIVYKNVMLLDSIVDKIVLVIEIITRISNKYFFVNLNDKKIIIELPDQIQSISDLLLKNFKDLIGGDVLKDYEVSFKSFNLKK